jgi:hypothetical protein
MADEVTQSELPSREKMPIAFSKTKLTSISKQYILNYEIKTRGQFAAL